MLRGSAAFLPIFVVVYVASVNALAALFVSASIQVHEDRHAADPIWAARAARSTCRYQQSGLSAAASRQRALRDHQSWPPSLIDAPRHTAVLLEAAIAETCPGLQVGQAVGQKPAAEAIR